MSKIRVNLYFDPDHPIMQVEKGKRATKIYEILDDWFMREERLKHIESLLEQINAKLSGSVPVEPTPDQETVMNEVLKDLMNLGKKGGPN